VPSYFSGFLTPRNLSEEKLFEENKNEFKNLTEAFDG
jgi:hypothetical protein